MIIRESVITISSQQWEPDFSPDCKDLQRLQTVLDKTESEIYEKIKYLDKVQYLQIIRKVRFATLHHLKTHEVYQLVIFEIKLQLKQLKLEIYGDLMEKVSTGQNIILVLLLQLFLKSSSEEEKGRSPDQSELSSGAQEKLMP